MSFPRIECRKTYITPKGMNVREVDYTCTVDGREGEVQIVWMKIGDPRQCMISHIQVIPARMRGMGMGTQALFDTFLDMYAEGCREFTGIPLSTSEEFWEKIRAPFFEGGKEKWHTWMEVP